MNALSELKSLYLIDNRKRYPSLPENYRCYPKWTDKTSNGLAKMVIAYIRLSGGQAYRINSQGQYDNRLKKWRYSGMRRGLPDIQGLVNSKFIGIELKVGRDVQSDHQKQIQAEIEGAQGIYFIARTFQSFFDFYQETFAPVSREKQQIV